MKRLRFFTLTAAVSACTLWNAPQTATAYSGGVMTPIDNELVAETEEEDKEDKEEPKPEVAEKPKLLTIGNKAPSLDISDWVSLGNERFSEVTDFKPGQVYVVEFWATWCGPCIASMPHLAETQEKYIDQVQLVSISDEDRETVDAFLERKVRGAEEETATYGELTSGYCLTTDPDRSNYTNYMKAAKQNGIPTAFIVGKSGVVEWIGHPMSMDKPLAAVVGDSWDREAFAEEFKSLQKMDELRSRIQNLARSGKPEKAKALLAKAKEEMPKMALQLAMMEYSMSMQSKDYDAALEALATIEKESEEERLLAQIGGLRINVLISAEKYDEAAKLIESSTGDMDAMALNMISWAVYEKSTEVELPKSILSAALQAAGKGVAKAPGDANVLDTLAHLLYATGDKQKALEIQTKAVKNSDGNPGIAAFLEELKSELDDKKAEPEDK